MTINDTNAVSSVAFDPIDLEVFRGRLEAIADEIQDVLIRSSFSTIVTEAGDATAALFDEWGATVAQACAIPVHLGTLSALGKRFADSFPVGVASPGDLYVINDPYDGGTHLPDIAVAAPVFTSDGSRLVGYVATMSHHQDIGGARPGSTPVDPYDLHAEGMRIPMMRLGQSGSLDDQLVDLLAANSRSPDNIRGDLAGQAASCLTGAERLSNLCERMGIENYSQGLNALMDYAEKITRRAIEQIPDGRYAHVDWLDDDGLSSDSEPVKIAVAIEVSGSEILFDFSGTAPQVKSSINNVKSSTLACIYFAVRTLTGDEVPNNEGCYRPITALLPPGTIVNAEYPAPVAARGVGLIRVVDAVFGAMAAAVPSRAIAAGSGHASVTPAGGVDDLGKRMIGTLGGPLRSGPGARATKDGLDVSDHGLSNAYHIPVEIAEARLPIRYHSLGLWTDSGGAGRWRGGLGFISDVEWLRGEATVSLRFERQKLQPFGVFGGKPAPLVRLQVQTADGVIKPLHGKVTITLGAGDRLQYWSTGGGGYGDPLLRDPAKVMEDVLEGRVSERAAEADYGVLIREGKLLEVDSAELRNRLKTQTYVAN